MRAPLYLLAAAGGVLLLFLLLMPLPEPTVKTASRVLDVNGQAVAWLFQERRDPVPLEEIPLHLQQAVIAAEDTRFFRHPGVDPVGIARSLLMNLRQGRVVAGGSTITQQLARNLYLDHSRTLHRKVVEAFLALKLEARLSKEEILEMYLNQIYWGHGAYGAEMASRTYFGKPVSQLTRGESSLLAAVIASPENYSPYRDLDRTLALRGLVLDSMVNQGFLDPDEAAQLREEPVILAGLKPDTEPAAPQFVEWVLADLDRRFPGLASQVHGGGYVIETTLNLDLQRTAQEILNQRLDEVSGQRDERGILQPQGSLVALDPRTGGVLAMVGGRSDPGDHFNRAVSQRQPGSAFKVFVYTEALAQGNTIAQTQECTPVTIGDYEPQCHIEERFHFRDLGMREAMALSCNVSAVLWGQEVGTARVAARARSMGLENSLDPDDASLVLGSYEVSPLQLARAYLPLVAGGRGASPHTILRVTSPGDRVIYSHQLRSREVLDPRIAFLVTSLLEEVMTSGTGRHLGPRLGFPAAGKTGTTDGGRDAWFVGYTTDILAAVWVGYDIPQRLPGVGGTLAGPIWADFMIRAHAGSPPAAFTRPPGVVEAEICPESGLLAHHGCTARREFFLEGTLPSSICPLVHQWDDPIPPWLPFRFPPRIHQEDPDDEGVDPLHPPQDTRMPEPAPGGPG